MEKKFLDPGELPYSLKFSADPAFEIFKFEFSSGITYLTYKGIGKSSTIYFDDENYLANVKNIIEVVDDKWYGKFGKCCIIEEYQGILECHDSQIPKMKEYADSKKIFKVEKAFLSNKLKIKIVNSNIGEITFKCSKIIPKSYKSFVLNKLNDHIIEKEKFLKEMRNKGIFF